MTDITNWITALEARVAPAQPAFDQQQVEALTAKVLALPADQQVFVVELLTALIDGAEAQP